MVTESTIEEQLREYVAQSEARAMRLVDLGEDGTIECVDKFELTYYFDLRVVPCMWVFTGEDHCTATISSSFSSFFGTRSAVLSPMTPDQVRALVTLWKRHRR
jgi:hypothetical protein